MDKLLLQKKQIEDQLKHINEQIADLERNNRDIYQNCF